MARFFISHCTISVPEKQTGGVIITLATEAAFVSGELLDRSEDTHRVIVYST